MFFFFFLTCRFFLDVLLLRMLENTSYVLSFRMVFFYLVTTGWIFDIILCENLITKSIEVVFRVGNQYAECEKQRFVLHPMIPPKRFFGLATNTLNARNNNFLQTTTTGNSIQLIPIKTKQKTAATYWKQYNN